MVRPEFFVNILKEQGIDFYAGVPDSLLKNICAYITDHLPAEQNIIAANEGGAMGIAVGYHLATGKVPVVYMQNSGEGNIINPFASLTDKDVYNIPVLLVIGWRGRPGVHDEPQHVKQGKVTIGLLNTMGINYAILPKDEEGAAKQIKIAVDFMKATNECYALVIEKDTFDTYKLQSVEVNELAMSREETIQKVASNIEDNACIVSTTGMISRELFEARTAWSQGHERDFPTVGAAITASMKCKNYVHIVFNNGAHDSVGGQPTVGLKIDFCAIAQAVGYKAAYSVETMEALEAKLAEFKNAEGPVFLQICVKKGNRKDLGRPTTTPIQNKEAFMEFLNK